MTTFVALLRAVNVAGNKVDMAALRSGLTGLGLEGRCRPTCKAATSCSAPAAMIRRRTRRPSRTSSRPRPVSTSPCWSSRRQGLAGVAAANPFSGTGADVDTDTGADEKTLHVTFLAAPAAAGATAFAALKLPAQDGEQAVLHDRVVYLRLPHGYGRSKLNNAYFERVLRAPATTENWRTVKTLVEIGAGVDAVSLGRGEFAPEHLRPRAASIRAAAQPATVSRPPLLA